MADRARETLCDLARTYGPRLLDDPRRVEALLRDLCGECRREIFVAVNALRERVPADLRAAPPGVPPPVTQARLVRRLCDNLGLDPDVARWGVETWAAALEAMPALSAVDLCGAETSGGDTPNAALSPPIASTSGGTRASPPLHARAVDAPADPAPWPAAEVLTVSQERGANFSRIGDAIRAAPPGACVLVRPGIYAESLVLDKPVDILADVSGPGGTGLNGGRDGAGGLEIPGSVNHSGVVVETLAGICVRMFAERATVRGLTLKGRVGLGPRNLFAVDVREGALILEDCDVTSDSLACIAISGRTANPVLRRCRIHDAQGSGIFVHEGGRGTVEDCAIYGHAIAGIEVGHDGDPVVRRCRIYDGRHAGIYVSLGGTGTVEDCAIFANAGSGVEIGWQGNPALRRCRINRNGRHGIRIYAGGAGVVEDCDLEGNALGPWDIEDGPVRHAGPAKDAAVKPA